MNFQKNHAIIASAGTGKTEQLALRYISLLNRSPADSTLAVTFTKNAAGEILERIIKLLVNAYFSEKGKKRLEEELNEPLEKKQIEKWLAEIIDKLPKLSISTLDSFFYQIVACYPLELGLSSAPDIAEGYINTKIQKKVIKQLFTAVRKQADFLASFKDLMISLTGGKESKSVTETLTETIKNAYEIFLNSKPEAWEDLSIQKKIEELPDWNALVQDYYKLVEDKKENNAARKFHKKLVDKDYESVFKTGPVIKFLKNEKYKPLDIYASTDVERLMQNIADYAFVKIAEESQRKTKAIFQLMNIYHKLFTTAKLNENIINYNDVYKLLIGCITAKKNEDGLHIYYRLDAGINNFLIDEFQDTSREQWQALQPLASEVIQDPDSARTFFMVGDVKQSIYGWRGGDPRLFFKICEKYDIKPAPLFKSYRSGKNILKAVNTIFQNTDWANEVKFKKHESAKNEDGYFEFTEVEKNQTQQSVLELIKQIKPINRGLSLAVLFRNNKTLNEMADFLKYEGIECTILGKSNLFQKSAPRRLLSLFELMDNPGNKIALYHLTEPKSFLKKIIPEEKNERHIFLKNLRHKLIYNSYASVISEIIDSVDDEITDPASKKYLEQLVELSEQYEPLKMPNPKDFLDFAEQTTVSSPENVSGIFLSTIHGAKGLGFDIVVLPNLEGRRNYSNLYIKKSEIDLLSNALEIETVTTIGKKELTEASEEYKKIREENNKEFLFELMNTLYVALTRAKKALYLIVEDSKPTKDNIANMRDIVVNSLPIPEGEKSVSFGDKNWIEGQEILSEQISPVKKQIQQITLKKQISRFRPHQLPSELPSDKTLNRAIVFSSASRFARERGTIIHALFEKIEWLDNADLSKEKLIKTAKEVVPNLGMEKYEEIVNEFLNILEKDEIKKLLKKPVEQCEVRNELSFSAIIDGKLTNGIFDRTVFYPNAIAPEKIQLFDYKTDAIKDIAAKQAAEKKYQPQMDCYVKALIGAYDIEASQISVKLIFTDV